MAGVNSAIRFENVTAGYRGAAVLEGLSFAVEKGEMAAVIGPNGAGKTSLLRAVTGMLKPASGSVSLFGSDVLKIAAATRARLVGVVSQEMETPMSFTVEEIVAMGRTASAGRLRPPLAEDRKAVRKAMVYADVVDMRDRPFSELSGGEKQRTVIAMVLAQQPRIVLLDEATAHLDMNHCLEIMQIVERLNREEKTTILMVSHDLNLSAEFCRRLLLMDHGRIVADGAPSDVLREDVLRGVYHCDVMVQKSPVTGSLVVMPARRLARGRCGRGVRVHVVAGGGCGEECVRLLALCEYTVTCGVLNRADSDADVAVALGLETALEKPFSHVGAEALARARGLADAADVVVVCGVPFGPGNVANLELARDALARGKRVFMMDGVEARDYTQEKTAARIAGDMIRGGAVLWKNVADLMDILPMGAAGERRE